MKPSKNLFIIFVFMFLNNVSYSYNIYLEKPNRCHEFPSHFAYPVSSIECRFFFEKTYPQESDYANIKIFVEQNGIEYLMYDQNHLVNQWLSNPINFSSIPNFCYNEIARVKVRIEGNLIPLVQYSQFGYFVVSKPGAGCNNNALTNGSSVLNLSGVVGTFFRTSECNTVSSSNYIVNQYKISFSLYGNFSDSIPVVDTNLSRGFNGSLPNYQKFWAAKVYQSSTEARFYTFVYRLYSLAGQQIDWAPCRPEDAAIVYRYVRRPVIQNLVQWIDPINPINPTAFIICNLQQGNGDLIYQWRDTNETPSFTFQQVGNYARVTKHFNANHDEDTRALQYTVLCRTGNQFGFTPWKSLVIRVSYIVPACPMIRFTENGDMFSENSILVSSPAKQGKDIKDYYLLMNPVLNIKEQIEFTIHETENFNTSLDKLQLIAASANLGEEIAVTQDGEIINFINDERKASVIQNEKGNVSEKLYYNDDDEVELKENDNLKVTLIPDGSGYVMLLLRTPVNKDNIIGTISTNTGKSLPFYSRDNTNKICIKLKENNLSEFHINIKQDITINQIAVVKNLNTYELTNLNLKSAEVNSKDVSKFLLQTDENYVEINKDNELNLIFENQFYPGKNVEYILESTGRYSKHEENLAAVKTSQSKTKFINRLFDNSPNPFNPVTNVKYELLNDGFVKIKLYDMIGREVRILVNEFKRAGSHSLTIDGSELPTGIYFYKMETENFTDTKRMILIK